MGGLSRRVLLALAVPTLARDQAECTRTRKCNGPYLCANTCVPGTVTVDAFAKSGLALQRQLQQDECSKPTVTIGKALRGYEPADACLRDCGSRGEE